MRVLCDRLAALVIVLGLLFAASLARAQGYDAALSGFVKDSFGDTETAINAVAASGNPLA
ncbi:MAG: urea ABC transporter permease subunit UrtB, partial [Xanthobacteraceae bacterium]|nr:urea ABC transporter permease subunit UrtB [Xanthobacteraceae bacterium]